MLQNLQVQSAVMGAQRSALEDCEWPRSRSGRGLSVLEATSDSTGSASLAFSTC